MLLPASCPVRFSNRTHLVPMEVVRAIRGISADTVLSEVESGKLRFVFNLTARGSRAKVCEWRFWIRELTETAAVATLTARSAVAIILGEHGQAWKGTEIGQLLLVSRPVVHRLHRRKQLPGQIKDGKLWIGRAALEQFLLERLISAP